MRVKIAYTVGLEEVEAEVQQILSKSINDIQEAVNMATEACTKLDKGDTDLNYVILNLEKARHLLFKADSNIGDCSEIISGYSKVLEKAAEQGNDDNT